MANPSSVDDLDDARERFPELGFALYAILPGGVVTLEIHTPDAEYFTFTGLTETDVFRQAFPPPPPASVFD